MMAVKQAAAHLVGACLLVQLFCVLLQSLVGCLQLLVGALQGGALTRHLLRLQHTLQQPGQEAAAGVVVL